MVCIKICAQRRIQNKKLKPRLSFIRNYSSFIYIPSHIKKAAVRPLKGVNAFGFLEIDFRQAIKAAL